MRHLLCLLLVGAALGGCIDAGETSEEGTVEAANAAEPVLVTDPLEAFADIGNASVEAPVWAVGHAWTVEDYDQGGSETCTLAVVAEGTSYHLASTCEAMAIADAVFDMSFLGPIRAGDLGGAQRGTPVRFFDFPLEDGKTWTTTWDGQEIRLHAAAVVNLAAPGAGTGPGFAITGTDAEGETYVTYDYAPAIRWWTKLEFADGYGIRVQKFEEGWTGVVHEAAATRLLDHAPVAPGFFAPAGSFAMGEGASALAMLFAGSAEGYSVVANVLDPDGNVVYGRTASQQSGGFFDFVILPPQPGEWRVSTLGSYNPEGGGFTMTFDEVVLSQRAVGPSGPAR